MDSSRNLPTYLLIMWINLLIAVEKVENSLNTLYNATHPVHNPVNDKPPQKFGDSHEMYR